MRDYTPFVPVIATSPLFAGLTAKETGDVLGCLGAKIKRFSKQEFILNRGETITQLGLLLSGAVLIVQEDFWGNRNLLARVMPPDLFAETYACTAGAKLGVSAVSAADSEVLFLDLSRLSSPCAQACGFHAKLIRNLLAVLAQKNLRMNEKLTHMAQRTTREKLLSYLSAEALRQGSASFSIAFNRQQLADYLSVERSAMSAELSKMRAEGLLECTRSQFTLLRYEEESGAQ